MRANGKRGRFSSEGGDKQSSSVSHPHDSLIPVTMWNVFLLRECLVSHGDQIYIDLLSRPLTCGWQILVVHFGAEGPAEFSGPSTLSSFMQGLCSEVLYVEVKSHAFETPLEKLVNTPARLFLWHFWVTSRFGTIRAHAITHILDVPKIVTAYM